MTISKRLAITPVREHHGGSRADLEAELAAEGDPEIGYYHSYEITGSVNGPGIRFTLYLSGCPLRCQYCQNPDMWTLRNGRRVTVGRMFDEVAKYASFIRTAHGGITVSGGEPMLQIRFLQALLRRCKQDLGLHTAVDTSGFLGARASEDFLDLVDLFLLDIKAGDEELYHLVTSAELAPTLRFARRLSDRGNRMWVRYVLVPGLTDAVDDVEKVARFTSTLAHVERVEVLPFHQLGAGKWADLQLSYQLADVPPAAPELVRRVEDQFRAHGLTVV
ncbi:MAG: pyruvate formate-lyase-activating protein [Streptosporangiaceae bacterium]|jgi:pyruvate formate lyase activating enzyme